MFEQAFLDEASILFCVLRQPQNLKTFVNEKNMNPMSCRSSMIMNKNAIRPMFSRKFIDSYPIQSKLVLSGGVSVNLTSIISYGSFVLKLTILFKCFINANETYGKLTLFSGI